MNISHHELIRLCKDVFQAMGHNDDDATLAANVLVSADVRGIDSHGVARLSGYIRLWEADRINPKPQVKIIRETPSTATVDGDKGLGLIVGPKSMQIAIEKATHAGTGWVAVKNSNHYGIAAYHSMMALNYDMIGWSMTNASPLVAPTFSREKLLGTNPISIAIPSGKEAPYIADFATTTVANGKLEVLQREEKEAPEGWVQDNEGRPTTDPYALHKGGAMLPLGGDRLHGSHKGYILGSMVDILSSVLSGAGYGPWAPPFVSYVPLPKDPVGDGLGHFFGAMRVDGFRSVDEFKSHMDNWLRRFRNSQPADETQPVLIPGDPEREQEAIRKKTGIHLNEKVFESLQEAAKKFSVAEPQLL